MIASAHKGGRVSVRTVRTETRPQISLMNDQSRVVDWPPPCRPPRRNRGILFLVAVLAAILFGGGTTLSYYVERLWFDSLGYVDVFWRTLNVQAAVFALFAAITFVVLYGAYAVLKPARLGE